MVFIIELFGSILSKYCCWGAILSGTNKQNLSGIEVTHMTQLQTMVY